LQHVWRLRPLKEATDMRIFVTGGTGYIGSAVVRHLVGAGHTVTCLVRTAERQARASAFGAKSVVGDLKTPASYAALAAEQDASVHLGFEYGEKAAATDRSTVDTLLSAARSAGRPYSVVYTSGVLVLGPAGTAPAFEDASTAEAIFNTWRPGNERVVLAGSSTSVAVAVIRPGWVYGGEDGLPAGYFESAVKEGAAAFVGDGQNRMPLVQREDIAELYRLALEKRATGIFHGVEDAPARVADYAAAASRAAGKQGAVRSIPLAEAMKTVGPFAEAMCVDQWVGSRRAPALGWKPRRPFLESTPEAFADWQTARASR
jgi:nucleoside-diphosphate-sugar epimerase